jgi:hypothetical protein
MNVDLVENSVKYHGKKLLDMILRQNNCDPLEENAADARNEPFLGEKSENLANL